MLLKIVVGKFFFIYFLLLLVGTVVDYWSCIERHCITLDWGTNQSTQVKVICYGNGAQFVVEMGGIIIHLNSYHLIKWKCCLTRGRRKKSNHQSKLPMQVCNQLWIDWLIDRLWFSSSFVFKIAHFQSKARNWRIIHLLHIPCHGWCLHLSFSPPIKYHFVFWVVFFFFSKQRLV